MAKKLDWLDALHPVYRDWERVWERNERRLEGGDAIKDELIIFDWETRSGEPGVGVTRPGEHYEHRQEEATYINFPEMLAATLVDHVMQEAPVPGAGLNFGQLGEVRRQADRNGIPTAAELVYYNADGVGSDGSQWDNFWSGVTVRAMATGHRWLMVEAPRQSPENLEQERLQGRRPYLVEFSPLNVTNWFYRDGQLQFLVVRVHVDEPRIDETGKFASEQSIEEDGYLLMVRDGFANLGPEFAGGGWWLFNSEHDLVNTGTWDLTNGEIPAWPHFYQRYDGRRGAPALSRPGLTEVGNLAVSYMNLSSAADFDAWDAAQSILFMLGVEPTNFNIVDEKIRSGSRFIPVPVGSETERPPELKDGSMGAVAAEVFDRRLDRKLSEARHLGVFGTSISPYASGVSKEAEFQGLKAPRLSTIASELEASQNTAIRFLELRWGFRNPSGAVRWTRDFDLVPVRDKVTRLFTIERLAMMKSPTLGRIAMMAAARDLGVMPDSNEEEQIESEYEESARASAERMMADPADEGGDPTNSAERRDALTNQRPGQTDRSFQRRAMRTT